VRVGESDAQAVLPADRGAAQNHLVDGQGVAHAFAFAVFERSPARPPASRPLTPLLPCILCGPQQYAPLSRPATAPGVKTWRPATTSSSRASMDLSAPVSSRHPTNPRCGSAQCKRLCVLVQMRF
jgi:hypothetical protein